MPGSRPVPSINLRYSLDDASVSLGHYLEALSKEHRNEIEGKVEAAGSTSAGDIKDLER
jgi:hypothetical protein